MKKISRLTALLLALLLIFQMTAVATEMSSEDIYVEPTPIPQENLDADILMQLSNDAAEVAAAIDTVRGMGVTANQALIPLRNYPNLIWGEKIADLSAGTFVVVYDTMGSGIISGDWYKVCYNGQDGYIQTKYLNLCTCNVQEGAGLDTHADDCPDKMYYVSICALTAEEIAANWAEYTQEGKNFILLYLSWNDQVKLVALQALIGPEMEEQQITAAYGEYEITLSGNLPVDATVTITDVSEEIKENLETYFPVEDLGFGGFSEKQIFDLSVMVDGEKWQPTVGTNSIDITFNVNASNSNKVIVTHLLDSAEGIASAKQRGDLLQFEGNGLNEIFPNETFVSGDNNVVCYEQLSSEDGQVIINEDGSISFALNSFSILVCTQIMNGLQDLDGNSITEQEYLNLKNAADRWYKSDDLMIPIINWKRSSGYAKYYLASGNNIDWNYSTISGLTLDVENEWQVWNGSRLEITDKDNDGTNEYYSYNPTHYNGNLMTNAMKVGQISVEEGVMYDSAIWTDKEPNNGNSDGNRDYTIYRLQGEFTLPADFDPELWNYDLVTRGQSDYLYINDDLYVFIYPKAARNELSNDNFFKNFFAYWGGTSAREEDVGKRTFHGVSGTKCDSSSRDATKRSGIENVVDGWRIEPTEDNIGATIRKLWDIDNGKYKDETEYIIDMFVSDYQTWGACYRPTIKISAEGKGLNFQAVCEDHSDIGLEGAEFNINYTHDQGVDTRADISNTNGYLDYSFYANSRDITLVPGESYPVGFAPYAETQHEIKLGDDDKYTVDEGTESYDKNSRFKLKFAPGKKYLTFDYDGGTDGATTEGYKIVYCACGDVTGVVPVVTKEGFTFGGWKVVESETDVWKTDAVLSAEAVESTEEPLVYSSTGDAILQAIWIEDVTINYVPVVFNVSGEKVENTANTVDPVAETVSVYAQTISGSNPVSADKYHFAGWYQDEDCVVPVDDSWVNEEMLMPQKTRQYDLDMGYEAKTYYARFDYSVAPLTIYKEGLQSVDPHSSTMYRVSCEANNIDMTVAIYGNGSVTIKDLPVGTYTVEELTNWSWRYTSSSNRMNNQVTLTGTDDSITFTNTRNKTQWLDSDCYAENTFDGSAADRRPPETN